MQHFYRVLIILTVFFSLGKMTLAGQTNKVSVYFASDKASLDSKAKKILDEFQTTALNKKIVLKGHCDTEGDSLYNEKLSDKRVLAVKKYLVKKGFKEEMMEVQPLGERVSVNKNLTMEERAMNRRVEITIKKPLLKAAKPTTVSAPAPVHSAGPTRIFEIKGTIVTESDRPLVAEISISDVNGKEIANTTSGTDGKYSFNTALDPKGSYQIMYYQDSSFFSSNIIIPGADPNALKSLRTILPELKAGKNYLADNLHFYGGSARLLPMSQPVLKGLLKLMKKNKNLVIEIEGHVNYPKQWQNEGKDQPATDAKKNNQKLSEDRANMVYQYLIKHGIEEERLSEVGYGAQKMLFPYAETEEEQAHNRRVEIKVVSY